MSKSNPYIPEGLKPWPHELRVAKILAKAGHAVEFLPTGLVKTADILLDGVEFEIKSPKSAVANSLEHSLKKALRQSPNVIIDVSRIKAVHNVSIRRFLATQVKIRKQIKRLLMITKQGEVIDVSVDDG